MLTAEIMANGQIVVSGNTVSDSVKHEKICFMFPDSWKTYQKTAVFGFEDTKVSVVLSPENSLCTGENECYIPFEVINSPGFTVSVFGSLGESLATSARGEVRVIESGYAKGDAPLEPTPSEYQQITEIVSEAKQTAQSLRNDADNGLFKGEKGDKGDKGDKGEVTTEYANNTFANALKGNKSGAVVFADDISPVPHKLDVRLSGGKNLFNKSVKWPLDSILYSGCRVISVYVGIGATATISLSKKYEPGDLKTGVIIYVQPIKELTGIHQLKDTLYHSTDAEKCNQYVTLTSEDGYVSVYMDDGAYAELSDELQIEMGSVATDYAPYIEDWSTVGISRYGKNLINDNNIVLGGISASKGTNATSTASLRTEEYIPVVDLNMYMNHANYENINKRFYVYDKDKNYLGYSNFKSAHSPLTVALVGGNKVDENVKYVRFVFDTTEVPTDLFFGLSEAEYEPYIEPRTIIANADGTVNVDYEYRAMTLIPDNDYVTIDMKYNRDINLTIEKICKSLGI